MIIDRNTGPPTNWRLRLSAATWGILAVAVFITPPASAQQESPPPVSKPSPDKWEKHYYERVAQFEKENAAKRTVVMVGSSHVEGFDAERWLPNWKVTNRGISSDRIGIGDRGILHRLDNSVFDCDPAVVILQNGANDLGELWRHGEPSIDEIEECFRKVVRTIRTRLPDVPLIINGLFPTRDRYAGLVPLIKKLDPKIKSIAEEFDCVYLEVYSHFADQDGLLRQEFSREGLHLTDAGYKVWADLIDESLQQLAAKQVQTNPGKSAD